MSQNTTRNQLITVPIKDENDFNHSAGEVLELLKMAIKSRDYDFAVKIFFWIKEWSEFIKDEKTFNYDELISYKRGMVVQANLGFKIGSEQGGLHYCLVVEKDNPKSSRTVMVIPLSSVEPGMEHLVHPKNSYLGAGIFEDDIKKIEREIVREKTKLEKFEKGSEKANRLQFFISKKEEKLAKWRKGTEALINQMCALDKSRIKLPKQSGDELYTYRLRDFSDIDKKIKNLLGQND